MIKTLLLTLALIISLNAESLRVGTWNIRWFGDPEKGKQKVEDLAKYISKAKVKLLVLQEVCSERELKKLCLKLSTKGQRWQSLILPNRISNDTSQRCAIIWNNRKLQTVGSAYKIPLEKKKNEQHFWHRHPHAVKFSCGKGLSDFVFIPIHMKAYADKAAQRQRELKLLYFSLKNIVRNFNDNDLIILGDTNLSNHEKLPLSSLKALNKKLLATSPKSKFHKSSALDKIIVQPQEPESRSANFNIHKTVNDYWHRKTLSDHFLVFTDLTIMKDDD